MCERDEDGGCVSWGGTEPMSAREELESLVLNTNVGTGTPTARTLRLTDVLLDNLPLVLEAAREAGKAELRTDTRRYDWAEPVWRVGGDDQ